MSLWQYLLYGLWVKKLYDENPDLDDRIRARYK